MDPSSTRRLLERWDGGDREALDELLRRNMPEVRRYAGRQLGTTLRHKGVESLDIVQEAVESFLRRGPRFRITSEAHLRGLLCRIAQNALRNKRRWFRRHCRDVSRESRAPIDLDGKPSTSDTPSAVAERKEQEEWIRMVLEMLDEDDCRAIVLRDFEKLSFSAMAEELDTSEDAARMRYNRALKRLGTTVARLKQGGLAEILAEYGIPDKSSAP